MTSNRFRKLKGTPVVPKLKQMENLRVNPILNQFRWITLNHDSSKYVKVTYIKFPI